MPERRNIYFFSLLIFFTQEIICVDLKKPRVSIITSVFKGDNFIKNFLEDMIKQTIFNQCELIIINANSPGQEEKVIKEYANKHKNIIYKKLLKDPGIYGVWNLAISFAKADYITNANLDDRKSPDCLEILVKALEEDPKTDLVYSDFYTTYTPNQTFEDNHHVSNSALPEFSLKNMFLCLPGPCPMWKKSLHEKFGGLFDSRFRACGDWEMWLRSATRGAKFKKLNAITCLYYYNPEGLSTDPKGKAWRDHEIDIIYKRYKYLWK